MVRSRRACTGGRVSDFLRHWKCTLCHLFEISVPKPYNTAESDRYGRTDSSLWLGQATFSFILGFLVVFFTYALCSPPYLLSSYSHRFLEDLFVIETCFYQLRMNSCNVMCESNWVVVSHHWPNRSPKTYNNLGLHRAACIDATANWTVL